MNQNFHVTYEVITPESARRGEVANSGFEVQHGTLRDCHRALAFNGEAEQVASPRCLVFDDGTDYRTGEHRRMALHIPSSVRETSAARIRRLFGAE